MSSGSNYVHNRFKSEDVEAYSAVQAFAIDTDNTGIPSGATTVDGIYYRWDDDGFIGSGWHEEISGSPIAIFDFDSLGYADVESYIRAVGNLNAVFENWERNATMVEWDAFYRSVPVGCKERVVS